MNEIRVTALACLGNGGVDASLRRARSMIAEATEDRPDLVCLPELFAWVNLDAAQRRTAAEPVTGKFSRSMAAIAARHRVHILGPLVERCGDRIFNSMIWYDRKGGVVGVYRKTFPTDYEMKNGFSPGSLQFDAFRTQFGPIGCCICFDLNFREASERLAIQGCKLVIVPTMFDGLALMKAWAKLYRMYFISVAAEPYGAVVEPLGRTLVEPWQHGDISSFTLNLDFVVLHTDHNKAKFRSIKAKYQDRVEIQSLDNQSSTLLASRHPSKSAEQIAAEYQLETEEHYYRRSAELAEARRLR